MANKQRGEVPIKLLNTEYTMRPTFESLCEIEDRLGISLMDLVNSLQIGDMSKLSMKHVTVIIWAGIHGHIDGEFSISPDLAVASQPTLSEVGNMVREHGLLKLISEGISEGSNAIVNFLGRGIMGDEEVDKMERDKEVAKKVVRKKRLDKGRGKEELETEKEETK